MPRQPDRISIEQFYNENKEEHGEIKGNIKDLNTAINNHVCTIAADMGTMRASMTKIESKYDNIKWLIGLMVAAIAVGILAKLII